MSDKVEFALLANGLDFIESAIGHLSGNPSPRDLKYATLHLAAGIELILKERLRDEHWTMVFTKPENATRPDYLAGSFQSVALDDSIKRLANICGVSISSDHQKHLRNLRDRRNRLEHFGITDSAEAFRAATAEALAFIIDFTDSHLDMAGFEEDDRQRLARIRERLSEFEHFVTERWKAIQDEVDEAAYALTCPSCDQDALVLNDDIRCRFCGYSDKPDEVLDRFVAEVLGVTWHDIADGAEWPVHTCPECGADAFVNCGISEDHWYQYVCFACRNAWKPRDLVFCGHCGEYKTSGEAGGICDDCFQRLIEED